MEKLTCVSISIEDKTIQITPESTPENKKWHYGVKISRTKEQVQIEKLLQAIEKNPFATQAYYAKQIGVSKRTVSRIFDFFTAKWCVGTKWNKQKIELGNHKVGETEECKYWSMQMPVR